MVKSKVTSQQKSKLSSWLWLWLWLTVAIVALIVWTYYLIVSGYPMALAVILGYGNPTDTYSLAAAITYIPLVLVGLAIGVALLSAITRNPKDKLTIVVGLLLGTGIAYIAVREVFRATFY